MKTNSKNKKTLVEHRRNQILCAATAVFSSDGFENANTDTIANMADLGKGTLYRYFKSKEDLFLAVIDSYFHKLRDYITEESSKIKDPLKRIESIIKNFLSFFDNSPEFISIMIQAHEQGGIHRRIANHLFEHYNEDMKKFALILKNGIKKGLVINIDIESMFNMLMSILGGILHMHIFKQKKYKLINKASLVTKVFFTGIIKDKKRKLEYER